MDSTSSPSSVSPTSGSLRGASAGELRRRFPSRNERGDEATPAPSLQLVLICGGRGTRLGDLNPQRRPKAMFPINGRPLAEHLWRRFRHLSTTPPIVVHSAADRSAPDWAATLEGGAILCPQAHPDGVANAFALTAEHLSGPALFLLGDVILAGAFEEPWPAAPAVGVWHEGPDATTVANFGVRLEDGRVAEMVEKPAPGSGLVCGIGAYLLGPEHLAEFCQAPRNRRTGEREITEALRELVRRGRTLSPFRFRGTYLNVNEPGDVTAAARLVA